ITSLSMSREVERILGSTQELAEVRARAVFDQKAHDLALASDDLDALVGRLTTLQSEPVDDLTVLVAAMRANISALEGRVVDRLGVAERKANGLADLLRTDLLFQAAMMVQTRPLMSDSDRIAGLLATNGERASVATDEIGRLLQLNQ